MDNPFALLKDYTFRVVVTQGLDGPRNMAADEVLLQRGQAGQAVLRFYDWNPPALSLGYFQRIDPEKTDEYRRRGIAIVRRPTGGRAVFHEDEITYSVTLPLKNQHRRVWSGSYYAAISQLLLWGLVKLGIKGAAVQTEREKSPRRGREKSPWCFESKNFFEIAVGGKKLVGSAQRLYRQGLLQHGSILRSISPQAVNKDLWPRGKDGLLQITCLEELLERKPAFQEVVAAYTEVLETQGAVWKLSPLSTEEIDLINIRAREKYEQPPGLIPQALSGWARRSENIDLNPEESNAKLS